MPSPGASANAGGRQQGSQGQRGSSGQPNSQSQSSAYPGASTANAGGRQGTQGQSGQQSQGRTAGSSGQQAYGGQHSAQGDAGASGDVDFSEGSGGGAGGSMSYEEQVAILDRQLEGSMSEYDGMILRERRNILNRGDEAGSEQQVETFDRGVAYYEEGDLDGSGGEEDQPLFDTAGGGMGGGDDDQTPQVAQAGGNPYGSDAGGPGRANDRAYAPPADIPSGDDDDVVARQIREAAMYEDDPELREKLWEEYRKYKEQTR